MIASAWSKEEFEERLREKGRAYHIHHPFNVMLNSGAREPRADSRLGRESLLLSDQHSDQGRRHSHQLPRPRRAPQLGAAHPRPRRLWRRSGRHRILAAPGRGRRTFARARGEPDRRAARRALCRRCVRELRPPRALAGSRLRVADRAVRAGDPQATPRQLARALPVDRPRRACSTSRAASASRGATSNSASPSRWTEFTTRAAQERALEILQFKLDVLWQMNDAMAQHYGAQS